VNLLLRGSLPWQKTRLSILLPKPLLTHLTLILTIVLGSQPGFCIRFENRDKKARNIYVQNVLSILSAVCNGHFRSKDEAIFCRIPNPNANSGFYSFEKWFQAERAYELFKDVGEESSPNARGVKKITIAEAFSLDKKLLFLFDYGDEWKFTVEFTGTEEPVYNRKYPLLISKTGKSPEQYPASDEMF